MITYPKHRIVLILIISFALLLTPAAIGFAAVHVIDNLRGEVGHNAWSLGVRAYDISENEQEKVVDFTHKVKSKQGTLFIRDYDEDGFMLVKLVREQETVTINWNDIVGKFTITDAKNRIASMEFDMENRAWVLDDNSLNIIKENKENIQLIGAIAADILSASLNTCGELSDIQLQSLCPDLNNHIIRAGYDWTRSKACLNARNKAAADCSNQYCYGCHSYLNPSCDCICGPNLGDFFCMCSITGYPCKPC